MAGPSAWIFVFLFFLLSCLICVDSKAQTNYHLVFYNVENLFDNHDDPLTDDDDFTPQGRYHWTSKRLDDKIRMIYKSVIASCNGQFPDLIGLAEVENKWVLEQLISRTPLNKYPYFIVHKESPDPRGIDVALLFRTDRIVPVDYDFIEIAAVTKQSIITRDILHFTGEIERQKVHFFINHWPSRSDGYLETKGKRNIVSDILVSEIDTLLARERNPHIILMGDFNASPKEECITSLLSCNILVNLSASWKGGTIWRAGNWEIFDQIICSANLLESKSLRIKAEETKICNHAFLLENDRNYPGQKPFRTYFGPAYHGGISDHLPVATVLTKEPATK